MPRDRGLHEVLITEAIRAELTALEGRLEVAQDPLRPAEAADRIALHLSRAVLRALRDVDDGYDVARAVALTRRLVAELAADGDAPIEPGTMLRALLARRPDGTPESIEPPLIGERTSNPSAPPSVRLFAAEAWFRHVRTIGILRAEVDSEGYDLVLVSRAAWSWTQNAEAERVHAWWA